MLTALQQGAIDGSLGNITVFTPLHYQDAAKYITEINQPYVTTIVVMNKKWVEALPADLQKIVHGDAAAISKEIVPFLNEFIAAQHKEWTDKGGILIDLPADEQAALNAKLSSIGDDLSKDDPELNKASTLSSSQPRAIDRAPGTGREWPLSASTANGQRGRFVGKAAAHSVRGSGRN